MSCDACVRAVDRCVTCDAASWAVEESKDWLSFADGFVCEEVEVPSCRAVVDYPIPSGHCEHAAEVCGGDEASVLAMGSGSGTSWLE